MLKRFLPFVLMFLWIASAAGAAGLDFVPNVGQARDGSAFSTEIPGAHVAFRNTAFEYTFAVRSEPRRLARARMEMIGANPRAEIAGAGLLPGIVNVHTATGRFSKIPTYGGLRYKSLYPGIDLEIDGAEGSLKSTWVVAPHVDPARIRWRYKGFDHVGVDREGHLVLTLPAEPGEEPRVVTETAPVAWQDIQGQRIPVEVRYQERGDGSLSFEVGAYDKDAPLVIDPTLLYNKEIHGLTMRGDAIAADAAGNVYLAGETTLGSSFVTKLDPGTVRRWTTYFDQYVHDVELGPLNDVYLAGSTLKNGFSARLDNATGELRGEFVNGGIGHYSIAVDAGGNTYVAGAGTLVKRNAAGAELYNASIPVQNLTAIALDGSHAIVAGFNQEEDVYVATVDAGGSIVQWTAFGGSSYDIPNDIAVDGYGRIFVVGITASPDFPQVDPVDSLTSQDCEGPCPEGFITQLSLGLDVIFSTFFGGSAGDAVEDVAVEPDGTIFVAGWSDAGAGFPRVKPVAPQLGGSDAFAAKLTLDETVGIYGIEYSTPLGGEAFDRGLGLALRGSALYITGFTDDGEATAFLAKLHDGQPARGNVVNIDFQPESSEVADGYLPDSGEPYQTHGNGWSYGWVSRDFDPIPRLATQDPDLESNQQYDTYIHLAEAGEAPASWEIALKPGRYNVRLVAGNPEPPAGPFWTQAYAEGVPIISDWRAGHARNRWVEGIVDIAVTDGRLTLTMDSRTDGWTLAFVEISHSEAANVPPQVAITAPLWGEVFNGGRPVTLHTRADDLDGQIDYVEYFITPFGGRRRFLCHLETPPYEVDWGCGFPPCVGVPPGTYTVEAVATDNEGAVSRSFVTIEVQPFKTKRDKFKVELKVFLPDETLDYPFPNIVNWSVKGDDREFSTTSREYRVAQQVTVIPSKALDPDGIDHTTIANLAGQSVMYDTGSSVNPDTGRLTLQARSEWLAEVKKGVPYMFDFGPVEPNASITALARPDAFTSRVRFQGEASETIVPALCKIDWKLDVTIDANNPAGPLARVSGKHDNMPAYEIYVDGEPVYRWRPPFQNGLGRYCDPVQEDVDTGYILLK